MTLTRLTLPVYLLLLIFAVLVLLLVSPALAQGVAPLPGVPDFRLAGADPFILGGLVLLVMSSLKRAAGRRVPELKLSAWAWYGLALLLGVLAAFALYTLKYGAELALFGLAFPWSVVAFGIVAGIVGAGGRDLLKTLSEWLSGARQAAPGSAPDLALPLDKGGEGEAAALAELSARAQTSVPAQISTLGAFSPAAVIPGLLANPLVEAAIRAALRGMGLPADTATVLKVAAQLGPDLLLDGSPYLSEDSLALINGAVFDLVKSPLS